MSRRRALLLGDEDWSPYEIFTNLAGWYDASMSSTLALSGSSVTSWADRSANGRTLTPVSTSPTYSATGLYSVNKPAVVWPGSTNSVRMATAGGVNFAQIVMVCAYVSGQATWLANSQGLFGRTDFASVQEAGLIGQSVGETDLITSANRYNQVSINGGSEVTFGGLSNPAQTVLPLPAAIIGARNTAAATSGLRLVLGSDRDFANRGWSGPISEALLMTTALSDADRQKLEGYLAWKWGLVSSLPSGHPYKTFPPVA